MISFFVPEIFKFSYYANFISANNKAMLLKLAPHEIHQMVHILMLLWQHAWFQSPASSKWNITICDSTRQNTWSYLRRMPVPPSLGLLFNIFNCIFCTMQLQRVIFDLEEDKDWNRACCHSTSKWISSGIFHRVKHACQVSIALLHYWRRYS